jgi:ABC-type branched-subunit amino acid transport system substrate-binding protein
MSKFIRSTRGLSRRAILSGAIGAGAASLAKRAWAAHEPGHNRASIALLTSLTGPFAGFGNDAKDGAQLAIDRANEIYRSQLGNVSFTLTIGDTQTSPDAVNAAAQRLAAEETPIGFLDAGMTMGMAAAAARAAERLKIPLLESIASGPFEGESSWSFRLAPTNRQIAERTAQQLADVLKAQGISPKGIAVSGFGSVTAAIEPLYNASLRKLGFEVSTGPDAAATSIDPPKTDVWLISFLPPANATRLFEQLGSAQRPRVILVNTGLLDLTSFGAAPGIGKVLFSSRFVPDIQTKRSFAKMIADQYQSKFRRSLTASSALGFTAVDVLAAAAVAAGVRNQRLTHEDMRKALSAVTISAERILMPWQKIQFDPGTRENVGADIVLAQITEGKAATVSPAELATQKANL